MPDDDGLAPVVRLRLAPAPRRLSWRHVRASLTVSIALGAALLAFGICANSTFPVGPARVSVGIHPALRGTTTLSLPPFGSVTAATHAAPLGVSASLQEVDLPQLQRLAVSGMPDAHALAGFRDQVVRGTRQAVMQGLLAALVASALVSWALRRSWKTLAVAAFTGVAIPALLVGTTALGFDTAAFKAPRYEGAMRYAPALIGFVQSRVDHVGDLQAQVNDTVRELSAYYQKPQQFSAGGAMPNTYRVLHVSDLHLDPIGFQLEKDLATEFHASLILDTGDESMYGTQLEGSVLQRFLGTNLPRVYVPGNHDSPAVVAAMRGIKRLTVLESSTITVDGLSIYGIADPMSRSTGWKSDLGAEASEAASAVADLKQLDLDHADRPDIIMTHDPRELEAFGGMAPLLLAGHTHEQDLGRWGQSWFEDPGTVGGVAYNKLYEEPALPHGAAILYYTLSPPRRLVAIDQVSVVGNSDQTSLKRTIVDSALLEQLKEAESARR